MNSKDLWIKLYNMETKEIQVEFTMMFMFLVKDRGLTPKEIIKDLEKIYKKIG